MGNKRKADDVPVDTKKNKAKAPKIRPSTVVNSKAPKSSKPKQPSASKAFAHDVVVPATPSAAEKTPTNDKQKPGSKISSRPVNQQKNRKQEIDGRPEKKQGRQVPDNAQQPSKLPLEPFAAILKDLQPKYDVRTLSVISSTRMEKRIKAVLEHLASPSTHSANKDIADALPGIALLHARATDANRLISIVEVVKRRMRQGYFAANASLGTSSGETADFDKKKKGKKASRVPATAWYQYNRIYDVASAKVSGPETNEDVVEDSRIDQEDDGFEPMVHRFEEAVNGKKKPTITTYLSIILCRTPVVELQRHPEMATQSSVDVLEVEYQQWMAKA
ncbi:hypothetical protein SEPCBS57363_004150 [Sporothrix epigloea]|uniref:DNA/RNA-binding protein Alba-like domain-containing protein n=1 Tax=Sporothrix epigloea TaxID=1892477 RepID=A0ABP0DQF7_9PEZI